MDPIIPREPANTGALEGDWLGELRGRGTRPSLNPPTFIRPVRLTFYTEDVEERIRRERIRRGKL